MNQTLTIILALIFSGTALFGETPGKLAATTQDAGPQGAGSEASPPGSEEKSQPANKAPDAMQPGAKEGAPVQRNASPPGPTAGSATTPVWLPVQADSAEYQKLAGPELVLVGRIEVAGQGAPCRVAVDKPWLPVADLGRFQESLDKLRSERSPPQINRMKILMKAKLKRDRSQGKHPVVVVGWLRELRPDEPDWQMPWPVNLPLLPPERELLSIPMIVACQATKAADSALGYSGVHHARQRFRVLEVFHGDAKVGEKLDLRYSYMEPGMGFPWSGRDVNQGERVIWVVSGSGDGIHGYGAIADTPHNRQLASDLAARVKDAPPQTRFDLLDLDLSKAQIKANQPSEVDDVFELPPGSATWQVRKAVKVVYSGPDGEIYFVPEKKVYYLRRDLYGPTGSATHYYFGPFDKDPSLLPNPPPAQPDKPSENPTDQPSERSAEELLGKAAEAMKAVQARVKEDRILGPLSTAKPRADGPKSVELSTTTPESWADFPTKPGGTTRGHGRLRISVYANLPDELPCTPFMPPKGCYWGSTYLLMPGTSAKVLVETVTSDPEAQRRLVKVVVQELAKVSITAHAKDDAKLDSVPQPESVLNQAAKSLRLALSNLGEEVTFEYAGHSTSLTVKYRSREFIVHGGSKTGAFSEKPHEVEGPDVNGFLLRVHAQDEGTVNQAVVPQTIRQPYWRTDLDVTVVPETGHQLYWALAYGSRTDESLLNRVRAAVKGLGRSGEVKLPPPEPATRKPDRLNLTLGWIADSDKQGEREYLFVLNGIVAYRTLDGLRNHVKGLPKGSTIRWAPGCCRMGDEPLLSSPEEMKQFGSFCESCGVTLEIIPSG